LRESLGRYIFALRGVATIKTAKPPMADTAKQWDDGPWHVTNEERLRIACRAASIGVWQWNLLTNEMVYSQIARGICGFPDDGPVSLDMVQAVTHPEDLQRTRPQAERALDPLLREKEEFRYRIIRADTGTVRWVKAYGEAQFAAVDGVLRAVTFVGSIQDITEEKAREDALAESADRLRLAIDAGQMAVWEVDLDTRTISGSRELNRLYRFPEESSPSVDELQSCYASGELERVRKEAEAIMAQGGKTLNLTIKHAWPDGVEKWLLVRAEVCAKREGVGQRMIGVIGDITESKNQEERLAIVARELRHRLMNLITVVGAIASRSWPQDHQGSRVDFQNRLFAIGRATDLMFPRAEDSAEVTLRSLLHDVTAPHRSHAHDPFTFDGPEVAVGDRLRNLAMAFHELATNALKYGSLSVPTGMVHISWLSGEDGSLTITWEESAGPRVTPPTERGLGSMLLTRLLFPPPDTVSVRYEESGVVCRFVLRPSSRAEPGS
jgi:two-component sensor histidine kinase